ncbi:hypothetical protein ACEPAH_2755 [Sanghuangporus vaninii]
MDLDNEVIKQVLTELKSYAHVVLPTLLVYAIECRVHLKAWHFLRQHPHLRELSKDDIESSAKESQIAEIRNGEEVVGSTDANDASGAEADAHGYGWYYTSAFWEIDWVKAYYPITLFLPAVFFISRALLLVSGFQRRIILRTSRGMALMVPGRIDRSMSRCLCPALICFCFDLAG